MLVFIWLLMDYYKFNRFFCSSVSKLIFFTVFSKHKIHVKKKKIIKKRQAVSLFFNVFSLTDKLEIHQI